MKTTLTWFDKLMITLTYAEENASGCLGTTGGKKTIGTSARPHGLGHGLLTTKAGA